MRRGRRCHDQAVSPTRIKGAIGDWAVRADELAYGVACLIVFASLGLVVWPALLVLPRLSWRRSLARAYGRALCLLLAMDPEVCGHIPAGDPCVYVANHTSWLDACALFVVLPQQVVFAAGTVLSRQVLVGTFLRRIGAVFVGSDSTGANRNVLSALSSLREAVAAGCSAVFFPEGGLTAGDELRRFHLGAFVLATETGCRVVPMAITGTRAMLPAGGRLARRGSIRVIVGEPLTPTGTGPRAARRLADEARDAVERLLAGRDT